MEALECTQTDVNLNGKTAQLSASFLPKKDSRSGCLAVCQAKENRGSRGQATTTKKEKECSLKHLELTDDLKEKINVVISLIVRHLFSFPTRWMRGFIPRLI